MGESKQIISAALQTNASQASMAKIKNGKNADEQLADEVKKLDQIRDMLFGEHVAALQDKYQTLDKNLDQSISVLREELNTSIADLKKQVDKRFDQLQKNFQAEQVDRESQHEELSSNLASINSDILTKIDLEAKRIDQAFDEQQQESTRQMNEMVDSLQNAKVDRKSLAAIFSQFAKELEGS